MSKELRYHGFSFSIPRKPTHLYEQEMKALLGSGYDPEYDCDTVFLNAAKYMYLDVAKKLVRCIMYAEKTEKINLAKYRYNEEVSRKRKLKEISRPSWKLLTPDHIHGMMVYRKTCREFERVAVSRTQELLRDWRDSPEGIQFYKIYMSFRPFSPFTRSHYCAYVVQVTDWPDDWDWRLGTEVTSGALLDDYCTDRKEMLASAYRRALMDRLEYYDPAEPDTGTGHHGFNQGESYKMALEFLEEEKRLAQKNGVGIYRLICAVCDNTVREYDPDRKLNPTIT